jgi:predicted nucleic acid-binding Zn ribbon protein
VPVYGPTMIRPMQPVAVGLQSIVIRSLRQAVPEEAPILAWPLVCGNSVSKRTRALDFAEGVLRVEVPDKGWRAELQAIAAQYLAIINRYVSESVKRIEFVTANDVIVNQKTSQRIQR